MKPTSKSRERESALYDMTLSPLIMEELARIPMERRIGPVIINGYTGRPYLRKVFNRAWRAMARKAGIPDVTQNRDARAGGITEADLAGVEIKDSSRSATHADVKMTETYRKETLEASKRVAAARIARRQDKASA
jgi:integrase